MMDNRQRTTVVGLFHSDDEARDAVEALKSAGFGASEIGILMRDRDKAEGMARETGTEAGAGAATGAVGGGILGGLAGWLVGIGALVIPGIGPFIAAGALGAALTGAAIGAGVGALAGALVGMGIPKEEAEWYENEVKGGRTLVTVRADGRYNEARSILRRHGAYDIENRTPDQMRGGYETTGMTTSGSRMSTTDTGYGDWNTISGQYRNRWQSRYGNQAGYRWEDYEPSYRYGWEMHNRPEYRGRSWREVEPEFRSDWQKRYRDKPWDRFADFIRDAWEGRTDDDYRTTRTSMGERTDLVEGERRMPLREEQMDVERTSRKAGEVRIGKDVETERRSMDVPYTREEVHVERRPGSGRETDAPIGRDSETIRVPVHEEEVDVTKRTVETGEIVVGKERVKETKKVDETLRREVPKIEKSGDVENLDDKTLTEEERRRRRERGPF